MRSRMHWPRRRSKRSRAERWTFTQVPLFYLGLETLQDERSRRERSVCALAGHVHTRLMRYHG
jgi:hypothetical protein